MKKGHQQSGFALVFTLVLMTLIVIVVVAYLTSTRIERSTASVSANRMRAKITADSALNAAIHLLRDNTRYGNYITAMPAPTLSPASIYTEIYRPADATDLNHGVKADDYLRLDNAAGDILVSRAIAGGSSGPEARPTPEVIPTPLPTTSPFTVTAPSLVAASSYDFNQTVTVGSKTGRLVQPSPSPAYGQWVNIRDTSNQVVGRYAFFIEDESMKVNVNYVGNNISGSNMRVNDLTLPVPTPTPASQIQEVDPSALLPSSANRSSADTNLTSLGNAGSRLFSRSTLGLLNEWSSVGNSFPDYVHLATTLSEDDNTTARGWQRLDLNTVATGVAGNAAKVAVATKIANWIRDAWTGSTSIGNLQDYQIFGQDWLRKQVAANIVDYISSDAAPTDMGDITPTGFGSAIPVIGLKKMPYLSGVNIVYEASNSTYPGSGSGTFAATVRMRLQFQFLNLYDTALDLANAMGNTAQSRIEVKGVPIIQKNSVTVYDVSSKTWTIKLSDLTAVKPPSDTSVPAGTDGTSTSGARTFQTNWLDSQSVPFTVAATETGSTKNPKFLAQNITVKWIGNKTGTDYRIDDTAIVTSGTTTKWCNKCGGAAGDFLKESNSTTRQIAAISYTAGYQGAVVSGATPGDPRYRDPLVSNRWNFDNSRTDADSSDTTNKLTAIVDSVDINCRPYGFDWFDHSGDRPLAFLRNGSMINIGEFGNIAACEYPWRTIYLQYPERAANTIAAGPVTDIPLRRKNALDYVLVDLFRTQAAVTRSGAININTQQQLGTQQRALGPLFLSVPVGTQSLSQTALDWIDDNPGSSLAASVSSRRVLLATPFVDNGPIRPFFQSGELASVLSRLVNSSTRVAGESRSTVTYSVLRANPTSTSESNVNYQRDMQVEQLFREVSNSITTRGNVFRVLYVGQTFKNGLVQAEYLGEAFVKRSSVFTPDSTNPDIVRTTDSTYKVISNRVITE